MKSLNALMLLLCSVLTSVSFVKEVSSRPLAVGDHAPAFSLKSTDGKTIDLHDYLGVKPVYLIFWNTWCSHCLHKVPKVIDAQNALNEQLEIIAINTSWSDSLVEIEKFQAKYKTNYNIVFDDGAKVTNEYDVWGAPTEFIIDVNGIVRHRDDLPDNLSASVHQWQQLDSSVSDTQLAGACKAAPEAC